MDEIKQIIRELEEIHFRYFMMEEFVSWWNYHIISAGFVSLGCVLDYLKGKYVTDEMEIERAWYEVGFNFELSETDFEPVKLLTGKWGFQVRFKHFVVNLI